MNTISASDTLTPVSLSEIRARHVELMEENLKAGSVADLASTIVEFMDWVAQAGAHLEGEDQRAIAQGVLDYWNATLLTSDARSAAPKAQNKLNDFVQICGPRESQGENPFQNIGSLGIDDHARFFGRDAAIEAVVNLLQRHPIVFLSGASGSGLTSLAVAGVAPQFGSNAVNPKKVFSVVSPGKDPLQAVYEVLDSQKLSLRHLRNSPGRLREAIEVSCGAKQGALLIIDNVEELFTRCADQSFREDFGRALASLADDKLRHSVLLVVRDRWLDRLTNLTNLRPFATPDARYTPRPPTAAEIRSALLGLADKAKVQLDWNCANDIALDLQGDPAAMALARFMLLHLWEKSAGGCIGPEAFQKLGSPNEALDRVAEETYAKLPEQAQNAAQRLFLTLCRPDIHHGAVSERGSRRALDLNGSDAAMNEALLAYIKSALVRPSDHEDPTDKSIEIINDRLMSQWARLATWLDSKRDDRFQLLAVAEAWQKSNHSSGYLLSDEPSIRSARKYIDSTLGSDLLREFIEASDVELEKRARRRQQVLYVMLGLAVAVICLLSALIYVVFFGQNIRQTLITERVHDIRKQIVDQKREALVSDPQKHKKLVSDLWWINVLRNFGMGETTVDLSKLKLNHENLTAVDLSTFRFPYSVIADVDLSSHTDGSVHNLTNVVMSQSAITGSKFSGSNLSSSQFRGSRIANTSFADANLYRVAFDNTALCNVDFTGASLREATVWSATIDGETAGKLRGTAWWLARGWSKQQIDMLLPETKSASDFDKIKNSAGFKYERERAENEVANTLGSTNSSARVSALNDLAWTLAIHGVDLGPAPSNDDSRCDGFDGIPKNAMAAAYNALCTVRQIGTAAQLSKAGLPQAQGAPVKTDEDTASLDWEDNLANVEDTLGYILLQTGQMELAAAHLKEVKDLGRSAPETLFRLSAAEFAMREPGFAREDMKAAIERGYVPTHERVLLAKMPNFAAFDQLVESELQKKYPTQSSAPEACSGVDQ